MICLKLPDPSNAGLTQVDRAAQPECAPSLMAPTATLGSVMQRVGAVPPFVKLDCEGFKMIALRGGQAMLRQSPPLALLMEYNSFTGVPSLEQHTDVKQTQMAHKDTMAQEFIDFFWNSIQQGKTGTLYDCDGGHCRRGGAHYERRVEDAPSI